MKNQSTILTKSHYLHNVILIVVALFSLVIMGACKKTKPVTTAKADSVVIKTDYAQLKIGDFYYSDGTFSTVQDSSKTCVGIVFSLKTTTAEKKHGWSHGQIVSIRDAANGDQLTWGEKGKDLPTPHINIAFKNWNEASMDKDGYVYTHSKNTSSSMYQAFKAARNFNGILPEGKTSGWYLPSSGQWADILINLGDVKFANNGAFAQSPSAKLKELTGITETSYWTSTEIDKNYAFYAGIGEGDITGYDKDSRNKVRPIAAL
jgi:hypothetical protein